MMKKIKRILDFFGIDKNNPENLQSDLSNNKMVYELTQHFKSALEHMSVKPRMVYPMSFNILLHPDDYEVVKESLPLISPVIVQKFYGIILDKKKDFPDYRPAAEYWFLQFTSCKFDKVKNHAGLELSIEKGHIATIASLFPLNIKNTTKDNNPRVSIKVEDSNVSKNLNFNPDIMKGMDILGENIFKINFDNNLNQDIKNIENNLNTSQVVGFATLSYSEGGTNTHYTMRDNLIHISGKNETRSGSSIFKIDSDKIMISHIQIKYIPQFGKFQIAAFGPARLNGRSLDLSAGGNIIWYDLADLSKIFINETVSINFEIRH